MRTADFDFEVPDELIAQKPATQRDASRLLVMHRNSGQLEHRQFSSLIDYLKAGDVLVLNNSKVIPARLRGANVTTGGQFELLLLEQAAINRWWVMLRPGKRAREGTRIAIMDLNGKPTGVEATVVEKNDEGHRCVIFTGVENILQAIERFGEVPLPPYIERSGAASVESDRERYQTVFAKPPGSVAAPTAGLHFTQEILAGLRRKGVEVCFVTLHVGLGTFAPVKSEDVRGHNMHEERFELDAATAEIIQRAKASGGRVVAVGTTTLRVLETVSALHDGKIMPGEGRTRIFIYPPYAFKMVDVLLTNFHLPRSTLVMLVSAFAAPGKTEGITRILSAYSSAVAERYRFYSYGDAMLIL